jgi:hypothetical protein
LAEFYKNYILKNNILKNTFLDYKVFVVPEIDQMQDRLVGENLKQILIIYNDAYSEETEAFLSKIMASVQINMLSDCLILRGGDDVQYPLFSQIATTHSIKKALIFGLKGTDLGLNITPTLYMPFTLNQCAFLFANPLSKITTPETKKALWESLKQIFN